MEDKQLNLFEENWTLNNSIYSEFPKNESSELEYKSAAGGFPIGAFETYSAFANSEGGFIVLGVSQKKGYTNIDGLEINAIPKIIKEFWDLVNNKQKVSKCICTNDDLKEVVYEGKYLIIIHVPAASRFDKPIYINGNPLEGTYKRNYEGDYKCDATEVKRMLADADIENHHDNRILTGYSMSDIDLDTLKKYRQMFSNNKPGHVWLSLTDFEFLEKIGGYRKDRRTNKEGFTVASIIMFGKTQSINDPECAPNFFPDYQEVIHSDPEVRFTDRIYPDGNWEANLLNFYLKVWPKLSNSLPKTFQMKDGQRRDETSAHIALREAFVNALIHADYTAYGNIVIKQDKDRYSFTNPGTLLITYYQYFLGGVSQCRNPIIQKMFISIGAAEKMGSGVNKIVSGWKDAHWRTPNLIVDRNPDRITLELHTINMQPREVLDELGSYFGGIENFSRDEITTLALCLQENEISNSRLQIALNKHSYDITRMLQDLCKRGYLSQDGKARGATYHINKDYPKDIHQLEVYYDEDDNSTEQYSNSESNIESNSESNSESNIESNIESKRLVKGTVHVLVLECCKNDYCTAEKIANETGASLTYLRNVVIPKLIKDGKLSPLYEFNRHKEQAYKTI